jgi:Ca2+-binding RTX toxin-like protein
MTFANKNVTLEIFTPTLLDPAIVPVTSSISENSIEFNNVALTDLNGDPYFIVQAQIDISQSHINYRITHPTGGSFADVSQFNGYVLRFSGVTIRDVDMIPTANQITTDEDRITFDFNRVAINVDALPYSFGQNLRLLVSFNLNGTNFANTIFGGEGHDFLNGFGGPDVLRGNAGNDTLLGGTGADTMAGGLGNDLYIVDSPGDVVFEALGQGIDQINSSVTRTLPSNVENLLLTGRNPINGSGNTLGNRLTGNSANNILTGLAGRDLLNGGGGNDTLIGANGGTFGKNEIDTLTGGAGADRFVLGLASRRLYDNGVAASPGFTDYAVITDFTPTQFDRLQLNGSASQYHLGTSSPVAGVPGRPLYHDTNLNGVLEPVRDELIAIIRSPATLTAANTINNAIFV